ncbi:MAG: RIP metalloprotease RseP [Pseudomonadales bacterium]|nr:RIP metalloprotease RseP [Pseudomonadales bacterium]
MLATVLYFLLTLAILIAVHEFGHFWVARKLGVKVLTFSIGFGRALWQRVDASGTRYVLAAIPLGGYVRMLDEREDKVPPDVAHQAFNRQPIWSRALIILAGPMANFLLAVLVYWIVFVAGVPGLKPAIGDTLVNSPAQRAGLFAGQEIVAVDGRVVRSRSEVNMALLRRVGDSGEIVIDARFNSSDVADQYRIPVQRWLAGEELQPPQRALGIVYWEPDWPAVVDQVQPGEPAAMAGLQSGDLILAIDGETISNWQDAVDAISARPGATIMLALRRAAGTLEKPVTLASHEREDGKRIGRIGISVQVPEMPAHMQVTLRYGWLNALARAVSETVEMVAFTLESIKKMLVGLVSTDNLSGPVTIAKIAGASASSGLVSYLQFLALISISLGVINLLPIPVLDGGQLALLGVEAVSGRPLPERMLLWFQQTGMLVIIGIMVLALYNDFSRL